MKKGWKIFLLIMSVLIVAIVIFCVITYNQFKGIMGLVTDDSLQSEFDMLMKGDCSILPSIESRMKNIEVKMGSACANPVIAYVLRKQSQGRDPCAEIKNPNSEMRTALSMIKAACEASAKAQA